jgi:mannose PTS system EIIA component
MIGVIIVTHGHMGQEVLRCAESIVGKQPFVITLGLEPTEGPDSFERRIRESMEQINTPAGILILADMMGGTPCNTALRQCKVSSIHFELVTGINLPMLVSVLTKRHYMPLEELAQKVVDDGPRTIIRPIQRLRAMQQENK